MPGSQYSNAHKTSLTVLCAFSIIQWILFAKCGKKYPADHMLRLLLLL